MIAAILVSLALIWSPLTFSASQENALAAKVAGRYDAVCSTADLVRLRQLNALARWRAKDMAVRNYLSHYIPPYGRTVFDYLDDFGITTMEWGGEIIGWNRGAEDPAAYVYRQFMDSAGHRAIIQTCRNRGYGVGAFLSSSGKAYFAVVYVDVPVRHVSRATHLYAHRGTDAKLLLPVGTRLLVLKRSHYNGITWLKVWSRYGYGWVRGYKTA